MEKRSEKLEKWYRYWYKQHIAATLLWSLAIAWPLATVFATFGLATFWPGFLGIAGVSFAVLWRRPEMAAFCDWLDQQYPSLQHSSSLLLQPSGKLEGLASLQRARTAQALSELAIQLPQKWTRGALALLIGGGLALLIPFMKSSLSANTISAQQSSASVTPDSLTHSSAFVAPELAQLDIWLQPPAYTGLASKQLETEEEAIPYYSTVQWTVTFKGEVSAAKLVFGAGNDQAKELSLTQNAAQKWQTSKRLLRSQFYNLYFQDIRGQWHQSDYFQLNMLEDRSPEIEIENLPQYAEYVYTEGKEVRFNTKLKDDYGISNAYIVATLTKGEGESVTFKNDTLAFGESFRQNKTSYELTTSLRLTQLGMEPGDELYLHIEALDNRQPQAQLSKTYKYIIAFEDTTQVSMEMYGRMAVNRMPEYFRSQRQIIIDTEKLIAKKSEIKAEAFQTESNGIGADQKLLRLRYGQFLGEEFETVIGPMGESESEEEHDHEDHDHVLVPHVLSQHEHDEHEEHIHDEDCEHTEEKDHAHEHEHEHDHGHEHGGGAPNSREQALEEALLPYYHVHDMMEEATFFDEATSSKLRAALANMWDAELHLRMGAPEKALPYEYQALKLIKEVQQSSRVYVERVGFEPPEIKVAEKRLSGELDEIARPQTQAQKDFEREYPAIASSLPVLEKLKLERRYPNRSEQQILQSAGEELATYLLDQKGNFLIALQQLRALMEQDVPDGKFDAYILRIQSAFSRIVPTDNRLQQSNRANNSLRKLYLKEISD